MAHAEPGKDARADGASVHANGEVEAVGSAEAGLLVEVRCIAGHSAPTEGLRHPDHAADLGAAQVGAFEAVEIRNAAPVQVLFDFVGVLHHGDSLVGVEVGIGVFAGKSKEGSLRLVDFLVPYKPPRRFRREKDPNQDWHCERPLQSEGDAVSPFGLVMDETTDDSDAANLTNQPAHVDVGREIRSKSDWHDLGGVGCTECLEDPPGARVSSSLNANLGTGFLPWQAAEYLGS